MSAFKFVGWFVGGIGQYFFIQKVGDSKTELYNKMFEFDKTVLEI